MEFYPGQHVTAHFLGNPVRAIVVEVGSGEIKVVEEGAKKGEWIPLSWCSPADSNNDEDEDY